LTSGVSICASEGQDMTSKTAAAVSNLDKMHNSFRDIERPPWIELMFGGTGRAWKQFFTRVGELPFPRLLVNVNVGSGCTTSVGEWPKSG